MGKAIRGCFLFLLLITLLASALPPPSSDILPTKAFSTSGVAQFLGATSREGRCDATGPSSAWVARGTELVRVDLTKA